MVVSAETIKPKGKQKLENHDSWQTAFETTLVHSSLNTKLVKATIRALLVNKVITKDDLIEALHVEAREGVGADTSPESLKALRMALAAVESMTI